jgi:hypothetical protein
MTETQTAHRTLFVGSLWHENCDPFLGVVATSRETCESVLREMAAEFHARWYCEDVDGPDCWDPPSVDMHQCHEDDIRCSEDDIRWSGVHGLTGPLSQFVEDESRLDEYEDDLAERGYAFV